MFKKSALTMHTILSMTYLSSLSHARRTADLANGIIPEDKKGAAFPKYHKEMSDKVTSHINDYARTRSQILAYFSSSIIHETDVKKRESVRQVAHTICMYLE